jgi:hypothetical protein
LELARRVAADSRKPLKTYWRNLGRTAQTLKKAASDPDEKNRFWVIQTFAGATTLYLDAYRQMARGQFYKSWCTLEQAEHGYARLGENLFIEDLAPLIRQRAELIGLWQSLFPYRHFASPGMRYKRWACSICGRQSTPVEPCGHVAHRVYAGQLCYRIIHEAEALEISIVTDPVQKYSVLQLNYDYAVPQYVLDHLTGPFHKWTGEWTYKRHPHDKFTDRPDEGPCPCNSGLRYAECCLLEEGVRLPHFQMMAEGGATQAGSFADQLVLHPPGERADAEDDRTFRVNLLKAGR